MTRLGFGLNVATKIMTAIVNKVLAADDQIRSATDSYIDDIVVNEDKVAADQVVEHLRCHGLEAGGVSYFRRQTNSSKRDFRGAGSTSTLVNSADYPRLQIVY